MIVYRIHFDRGTKLRIEIDPEDPTSEYPDGEPPAWTELGYEQCTNCPLSTDVHSHCPAALGLAAILPDFSDNISWEKVEVLVETEERTYHKRTDAQQAIRSLMGLCMATSGCPILSRLRAMAAFHLPFASVEETIFRAVSTYLVQQYFVYRDGGEPDLELDGLKALYAELETVNICFTDRIRAAARHDASLNAVVQLSTQGAFVAMSLEKNLERIRPLFESHFAW